MDIRRALILHGKPKPERFDDPRFDPSRANWLGWLAEELSAKGVTSLSPRLREPSGLNLMEWVGQMNEFTAFAQGKFRSSGSRYSSEDIFRQRDPVALIGHSAAAAVYLRWLSGRKNNGSFAGSFGSYCVRLSALVLVAPWLGLDSRKYGDFGKFDIDPGLDQRIGRIIAVVSNEDEGGVPESLDRIVSILPSTEVVRLDGLGHCMTGNSMEPNYPLGNGLMGSRFPELIEILEDL